MFVGQCCPPGSRDPTESRSNPDPQHWNNFQKYVAGFYLTKETQNSTRHKKLTERSHNQSMIPEKCMKRRGGPERALDT
jgi:hypothetical protein